MTRLAFLLPLAACTGAEIPMDTAPDGGRECSGLWGETFSSVEELECGLGPDGPVPCHWTVAFGDETYDWSYSDVGESGTVTCVDNDLVGTSAGGTAREGTFHRATARVTWEGVSYQKVE